MLFSDLTVMKMKGEIWVENVKPSVDNGKRYAKVTEGSWSDMERLLFVYRVRASLKNLISRAL